MWRSIVLRSGLLLLGLVLALAVTSCGEPSAEQKIRQLVADAELAAEDKNRSALMEMVSEDFADWRGRNKRDVDRMLRYTFMQSEAIFVFTSVRSIEIQDGRKAHLSLAVAMAEGEIGSREDLQRMRADLLIFEIDLVERSGEWEVSGAEWKSAGLEDFF